MLSFQFIPRTPQARAPGTGRPYAPPPSGSLALGATGGGNTWKSVPGSIFGEITLARFGGAGMGLGLIEHAP
jgi:hypothetical protein